jgi:hypothetical protein
MRYIEFKRFLIMAEHLHRLFPGQKADRVEKCARGNGDRTLCAPCRCSRERDRSLSHRRAWAKPLPGVNLAVYCSVPGHSRIVKPISILLQPVAARSLSPATRLSCKAHRVARSATNSRRDNQYYPQYFARRARSPFRVRSGPGEANLRCPLYPRKQTSFSTVAMSALCQ